MIKTVYQLFGIKICEITRYEDEKEMPIANESGGGEGVVIELSKSEIEKMEKDKVI